MAFEFHLPDLAEGMAEAEVVKWKVAEGDRVELDQPVVELLTDKATVEIPSPRAGTITKIHYQEGDVCPVGEILFVMDEEGAAVAAEPAAAEPAAAEPAAAEPARAGNGSSHPQPHAQTAPPEVVDATPGRERVLATPATRRLARKLGVELRRVPPTGKRGRVTTEDVKRFAEGGAGRAPSAPAPSPAPAARPSQAPAAPAPQAREPVSLPRGELEERVPFRGMRKRISDNMTRSKFTATHFTYVEEVDVTELVAVRERAKARAAERGIKLTYLPFIIKAVVAGLKKWPQLNASLDEATQELVRKYYYHIGIAAQAESGLMVSVVRDADRRSIFDVAAEIGRLAQAVQDGTIKREELTGSTFTISSLGKLGGLHATPIINFPEVGILGVHKIEQRAAVRDGEVVPRWMMNLSISLDHRLVDGWDGAMFLQEVKTLLEDPTTMFMEMV